MKLWRTREREREREIRTVIGSGNCQRQLAERKELPRAVTGLIGRGAVRKELRERQKDPNKDIRPDDRFKPPLVDTSPSCSDATGSDPYTNGSRLGYQEMVPESDGLIVRILPDGWRDSDRVSAFCTGYGIEPSVDGSVMTGPRLVLDGGMVLLTGYGAVEPNRTDAENAKGEHWRTDERLDLGSDQVGLTLCMGKSFCTGYGIEPSVDRSIMTGPRLVLDGGMVLLTGYGAVEPNGREAGRQQGRSVWMDYQITKHRRSKSSELAFQFHRFEVNPMVRSEVMPVLQRSGQSVSRERAVDRTNGLSIDSAPLPSVDGDARI
ncbi:hypothetical protein F2Q69_00007648 [Brassica cretica]|uniref:Uncharacterized protein n=1 Tax=Brassica cretica TaxID=69181 RepID=A0A8S9NZ76_BRACR|nr:hypothetical protein F2Q69_00007648 [Brassica cretica]